MALGGRNRRAATATPGQMEIIQYHIVVTAIGRGTTGAERRGDHTIGGKQTGVLTGQPERTLRVMIYLSERVTARWYDPSQIPRGGYSDGRHRRVLLQGGIEVALGQLWKRPEVWTEVRPQRVTGRRRRGEGGSPRRGCGRARPPERIGVIGRELRIYRCWIRWEGPAGRMGWAKTGALVEKAQAANVKAHARGENKEKGKEDGREGHGREGGRVERERSI